MTQWPAVQIAVVDAAPQGGACQFLGSIRGSAPTSIQRTDEAGELVKRDEHLFWIVAASWDRRIELCLDGGG